MRILLLGEFFFSFILFYFILFYFILFYFILFYFILFYFILFYFILFYFILFYFILFYFILFYFILFYFILFYFILFYFYFYFFRSNKPITKQNKILECVQNIAGILVYLSTQLDRKIQTGFLSFFLFPPFHLYSSNLPFFLYFICFTDIVLEGLPELGVVLVSSLLLERFFSLFSFFPFFLKYFFLI